MPFRDIIPSKEIYNDALSPSMKQIGEMMESGVKVARFLWAPVDVGAALHNRWQKYLKKLSERVPDENLIQGEPQIVSPTIEGLNLAKDESLISELFLNLLANSIDKTKQSLAHPAFPNIIKELSHDEAVILYHLKKNNFQMIMTALNDGKATAWMNMEQYTTTFPVQNLLNGGYLRMYVDHLISLNLINVIVESTKASQSGTGYDHTLTITLSQFAKLFSASCVPDHFDI